MLELSLSLPVDYILPSILKSSTADENALILSYGCELLLKLNSLYTTKVSKEYDELLKIATYDILEEKLKLERELIIIKEEFEIKKVNIILFEKYKLKELFEFQQIKINQLLDVQAMKDNYINEMETLKEFRIKEIENFYKDKFSSELGEILNLSKKFDKVFSSNSSLEKGKYGELSLESMFLNTFPTCMYEDCSHISESGDAIFTLNGVNIMIESKNVIIVRKHEIEKYVRDCHSLLNNNNNSINGSIFISLCTETIPGKGDSCFDLIYSNNGKIMPVMYITNILKNPDKLKSSIETMIFIIKLLTKFNVSKPDLLLTESMNNSMIEIIKNTFSSICENSKRITTLKDLIVSIENENNKSKLLIKEFFDKYPDIISSINYNTFTIETIKEFIIEFKRVNKKVPTKKELLLKLPNATSVLRSLNGGFTKYALSVTE